VLQFLIVAAATVVALIVGWAMQRRRPDRPISTAHTVPDQIDRADFAQPATPWLIAVFTSETCRTCAKVWQAAQFLADDEVAVQNVEVNRDGALHERYDITAVPAVVIADQAGVTRRSFIGPPSSSELWSAMTELRDV
jgi:hypothetical protein